MLAVANTSLRLSQAHVGSRESWSLMNSRSSVMAYRSPRARWICRSENKRSSDMPRECREHLAQSLRVVGLRRIIKIVVGELHRHCSRPLLLRGSHRKCCGPYGQTFKPRPLRLNIASAARRCSLLDAHIEVMAMAPILTREDVVRRIAAECTFIDERGGVGIRLKPAAAVVRQYGEQFRPPARRKQNRRPKPPRFL
jgi:hypothetical protein